MTMTLEAPAAPSATYYPTSVPMTCHGNQVGTAVLTDPWAEDPETFSTDVLDYLTDAEEQLRRGTSTYGTIIALQNLSLWITHYVRHAFGRRLAHHEPALEDAAHLADVALECLGHDGAGKDSARFKVFSLEARRAIEWTIVSVTEREVIPPDVPPHLRAAGRDGVGGMP